MQFASKGQWGNGLYFAKEAGYSDIYASKGRKMQHSGMEADESEMMLAELLLGDVIELDRDNDRAIPGIRRFCNDLKVPPHVDGTRSREGDGADIATAVPEVAAGARYNTVRGYTQTDLAPGAPGNATDGWTKNPSCPRSQVWIVRQKAGSSDPFFCFVQSHIL